MYFHTPSKLSVPFSTTYTQYTDFIFGSNLVPSKVSGQELSEFSIHSLPPGAPNKVFKLLLYTDIKTDVQTQTITFTCPLPILNTPYPKNSAIMIRSDEKLRTSIWYLHV